MYRVWNLYHLHIHHRCNKTEQSDFPNTVYGTESSNIKFYFAGFCIYKF